jgi:N-methylhydantoinase A
MTLRIGVDVGGTFTDIIVLNEVTGAVSVGKTPTIRAAVEEGVQKGLQEALEGELLDQARYFLHGTTVGLNALLERRGATVGLLTTAGFRDTLEIRRCLRVDERGERTWDFLFKTPPPLVPRKLRIGVPERILADGTVSHPLDEGAVRAAAEIFMREGVECVAVAFFNAYANPVHEREAVRLLRDAGFEGDVSVSYDITGQHREYERTSTTVIDAYVRPAVATYLKRLEAELRKDHFGGDCLVTTSAGGCLSFTEAVARPFETVMSGPVAGAVGAGVLCRELSIDLAITADVGGTSFDTCLLIDGRPSVEFEGRVVGMPLQTPWVDVRSVGAGGGSLATVEAGLLHVGPESAGALPGPVCYGRGGAQPTVTDGAVALGMLGRDELAGGLQLQADAARDSLKELGSHVDLTVEETACGIMRIASASMANAIRANSTEVGEDPRKATLIAYGGAGGMFASLLARELGMPRIVVPSHAGNFSASGLLDQDVIRSSARTVGMTLGSEGLTRAGEVLRAIFGDLERRAAADIAGSVAHEALFELRYAGQEYTLPLDIALHDRQVIDEPATIAERFSEAFGRKYGHVFDMPVEIVTVHGIERVALARPSYAAEVDGHRRSVQVLETRRAYSFHRDAWCDFPVVDRSTLALGNVIDGPAIVVEPTASTYVDEGFRVEVHRIGALIIDDTEEGDR